MLRSKETEKHWIAGDVPAPEWIIEQTSWFVYLDLNGDAYFQGTTNDGQPLAVFVKRGDVVILNAKGEWSFDGNPIQVVT